VRPGSQEARCFSLKRGGFFGFFWFFLVFFFFFFFFFEGQTELENQREMETKAVSGRDSEREKGFRMPFSLRMKEVGIRSPNGGVPMNGKVGNVQKASLGNSIAQNFSVLLQLTKSPIGYNRP